MKKLELETLKKVVGGFTSQKFTGPAHGQNRRHEYTICPKITIQQIPPN